MKNHKLGFCVCEDLWQKGPVDDLLDSGISILISLNASPFDYRKYQLREELLRSYAKQGVSIIYVNQIGGQDDLLFDGQSLAMDNQGIIRALAPAFEESLCTVNIDGNKIDGLITLILTKKHLFIRHWFVVPEITSEKTISRRTARALRRH
ncbi:hypothetical protein PGH45_16315 [Legionella pneumophila]|nr:hypothetical protein [Legionella pneumophila]